jgi:hypothetical protein
MNATSSSTMIDRSKPDRAYRELRNEAAQQLNRRSVSVMITSRITTVNRAGASRG